ncbi:MAG: ATP-dependent sacrificial sulfur transferase LarE [Oscillospiraceae bacterium]|nr:ATP-dependent sacrificial sulfur transferase LarE [Oscillospiraceae bacterium]
MDKLEALKKELTAPAENRKLCIAFSGGVDSALLVKLSCDAGLDVYAVTFDSILQPIGNGAQAAAQARSYGAKHEILWTDLLADSQIRQNTRERCYYCKYALFSALWDYAKAQGIMRVVDGTNGDDLQEYRPGLRALKELSVESPLAKLGMTKAMVRAMAVEIGLDAASRPSSPCLATRFPYGTSLTEEALQRCGNGEKALHEIGFPVVRLRVHGNLARVEVPKTQLSKTIQEAEKIIGTLQQFGYQYITLDLEGYRSGCFDKENL